MTPEERAREILARAEMFDFGRSELQAMIGDEIRAAISAERVEVERLRVTHNQIAWTERRRGNTYRARALTLLKRSREWSDNWHTLCSSHLALAARAALDKKRADAAEQRVAELERLLRRAHPYFTTVEYSAGRVGNCGECGHWTGSAEFVMCRSCLEKNYQAAMVGKEPK